MNSTFKYDGDGHRVKSATATNPSTSSGRALGQVTTFFVGNYYEVSGSTIIKYYYAGSQRIAMNKNGLLSFTLGDHLGSTCAGYLVHPSDFVVEISTRESSISPKMGSVYTSKKHTGII